MRLALQRPAIRNLVVIAAIVAPVVYSLVVDFGEIDSPPAWDSSVTVSPAALTIVEEDFDVWAVANLPSSPAGGPSTHATSLYTIWLALLIGAFGASAAFVTAHVVSIALVGPLAAATYLLARRRCSVATSALVAVVAAIMPLVVQQASDVYLDLPLAVITAFACWTATRRRFWSTAALILVGVAVKSSGVFLIPLILFARPVDKPMRRHIVDSGLAALVAGIPFLVVLATTHRFANDTSPLTNPILLRSSASLLLLTTDVFLVLSIYALVTYGRLRSGKSDRLTQVTATLVASFFLVHIATILLSGTIAILPRYYIVILPAVLATLAPREEDPETSRSRQAGFAVGIIALLGLFSVINVKGGLYPLPDHDFYVAAERSTRAQDLLALQVLGTHELVDTGLPLLVDRQVHFRLEYPGMGYVEQTPVDVTPVFLDPIDELPDRFAMLIERRYTNPLVDIEEAALESGYELAYEDLEYGPYGSQLIIASK